MVANLSMSRPSPKAAVIVRAVTVIIGTVVGLTFLFGFGNVLNLALRLGVPPWVALLVAPAVDLSVIRLLLGTRHLALAGASSAVLLPARRLLIFASVVTLALNVADPLVAGEYGKAAFDAVGPLLLIGWAEVGPGFLQAIGESGTPRTEGDLRVEQPDVRDQRDVDDADQEVDRREIGSVNTRQPRQKRSFEELLELARREDATHRAVHQKPISADNLRVLLGVGASRARRLVGVVRAERQARDQDRLLGSGSAGGTDAGRAAVIHGRLSLGR